MFSRRYASRRRGTRVRSYVNHPTATAKGTKAQNRSIRQQSRRNGVTKKSIFKGGFFEKFITNLKNSL